MSFYMIDNKSHHWGDYGDILVSGMTYHLERKDGLLQYERTGPWQPDIILSGNNDLLVTESFKNKLENSGFSDIDFMPVIKKHISFVNWTNWNLDLDDPEFFPESGEPEDYILGLPHSEELANQMEDVWEVVIPVNGVMKDFKTFVPKNESLDIMRPEVYRFIFVSEDMKNWLYANNAEWLDFKKI